MARIDWRQHTRNLHNALSALTEFCVHEQVPADLDNIIELLVAVQEDLGLQKSPKMPANVHSFEAYKTKKAKHVHN